MAGSLFRQNGALSSRSPADNASRWALNGTVVINMRHEDLDGGVL
jgi:hypothetical protein